MRRFDDEMSEWFSVIKGTSAALSRRDQMTSHYIEALSHLVDESLRYAASHGKELLVTRSHVGEILDLVNRNNGRIERERLKEATGLSNSRLSQVLGELTIVGALERKKESRHVRFVLLETGLEMLEIWREAIRATPEIPEEDLEPRLQRNLIVEDPDHDEDDIGFMKQLTLEMRGRGSVASDATDIVDFAGKTISADTEVKRLAPNQRFITRFPPDEAEKSEKQLYSPAPLIMDNQRELANA